jgi:hypothetical protein
MIICRSLAGHLGNHVLGLAAESLEEVGNPGDRPLGNLEERSQLL